MEASRRRRSIWWWFWTYFVVNTCNITFFSHVIIGIDYGRSGVTATTPSWLVVRRGRPSSAPDNKSLGCCCRNSPPTVINPLSKPMSPEQYHIKAMQMIFWNIFSYKNFYISIKISLKCVSLVQIMVWRRKATSRCRNQWRRIYAPLGLNVLSYT